MLPKNCPASDRNTVRFESEQCPTEIGTLSEMNRNTVRHQLESVSGLPRNTQMRRNLNSMTSLLVYWT